ncbi:hypothetical protein NDU88_002710 [Pleurodeles waltl]|uniref:Uncharacterized protein n=1 Tax=Pleurodeles waltl TaxID=8319 RepID=A0AAV7WSG7_PLEWA|nr:hypothetical protein NDU88_002710 [Pleurodeles waltl]
MAMARQQERKKTEEWSGRRTRRTHRQATERRRCEEDESWTKAKPRRLEETENQKKTENGNGAPAGELEDGGTEWTKNKENKPTGNRETVVCGGGERDEGETSETRGDGKPEDGVTEELVY